MSKKLPYSGSAAKKGRNFYSSGISQLMNRIDKLEHQVFCCGDDTDEVIDITVATMTAAENKDGAFFTFNIAGGSTLTLPEANASNIGWNCKVAVETSFSGTMTVTASRATDLLVGGVHFVDPTTAGDTNFFQPNGSSNAKIAPSADNRGRLAGGFLEFKIIDVNRIWVTGTLVGDGALATAFGDF